MASGLTGRQPSGELGRRAYREAGAGRFKEEMGSGSLDTYLDAAFAADPWSATQNPRAFRAPNGVVLDSREYDNAGKQQLARDPRRRG